MAKVEMDMTEYEALKEVKKQLEDSLKTERVLRQEIADAQEREVAALKANEKVVTVIREEREEEVVLLKNNPDTIVRQIEDTLTHLKSNRFWHHNSISSGESQHFVDRLSSLFFRRSVVKGEPRETVVRRGFDEVKEELKLEIEEGLKKDYEAKVRNYKLEVEKYKSKADTYAEKSLKYDIEATRAAKLEDDKKSMLAEINQMVRDNKIYKVKDKFFHNTQKILESGLNSGIIARLSNIRSLYKHMNDALLSIQRIEDKEEIRKHIENDKQL